LAKAVLSPCKSASTIVGSALCSSEASLSSFFAKQSKAFLFRRRERPPGKEPLHQFARNMLAVASASAVSAQQELSTALKAGKQRLIRRPDIFRMDSSVG
jgi:hypothetical protein